MARVILHARKSRARERLTRQGPLQRSQEASSTIHRTNPPNDNPAYAAISGTNEVSVIPG
jgi:hypothetical protein